MSAGPKLAVRHAPRCPLLLAACAYGVGIVVGEHFWQPPLCWIVTLGTCLLAAILFLICSKGRGYARYSAAAYAWVLAAIFVLGALAVGLRDSSETAHPEWQSLTDGREVIVEGWVVHDGILRGTGSQRRQSVDIQVDRVEQPIGQQVYDTKAKPKEKHHKERTQAQKDAATDARRRKSACAVNSLWPAELVRASGLPRNCATAPAKRGGAKRKRGKRPPNPMQAAMELEADRGTETDTSAIAKQAAPMQFQQVRAEGIVRLSVYSRGEPNESGDEQESESVLPPVYTYGERLRFVAKLREPRNFGNPGSFDYAGYLRGEGIYALASARIDKLQVLTGREGSNWGSWRSRMRRSVLAKSHTLWHGEQAGLLDAMVIGERSFIGRETNTAFQRTGIYHILVVSGMNVGILAFVIFGALRRFRCGDVLATILTILLSCWYAYLAESGAPIMRSVVMLIIYLLTRLLNRDRALLNALGAAALILLVTDPRAVNDGSFQLTFLSVLAIGGIAVPIIERTSQPYSHGLRWLGLTAIDMSMEPRIAQFRIDLRMIAQRVGWILPRWPRKWRGTPNRVLRKRASQKIVSGLLIPVFSAYELIVVSATTQVALALPMAWYFHRATVVGLAANLIAVPLTGVLMPASVIAVLLSYLSMPIARIPAWIASLSVTGITKTIDILGGLRAADLRLAVPDRWPVIAAVCAFVFAPLAMRRHRLIAAASVLALVASAIWLGVIPPKPRVQPGVMEVTGIDVGQAESSLVITPDGETVLVDAGGPLGPFHSEFDFGEDVVAPYLWARGISRLDAVALTHAHSDHVGGMLSILRIFHPHEFWMGPNAPDGTLEKVLQQAREDHIAIKQYVAGDEFTLGTTRVQVFAPAPGWKPGPKPKNNDSLVLRFTYGDTSALLTGDAEKDSEEYMAALSPRANLLKIAHNGSRTSTTPEFLAAVHPAYAYIEVGAHNSFGHPRDEVLERLQSSGVQTYRTDMLGAVSFYLDGARVRPKTPAR